MTYGTRGWSRRALLRLTSSASLLALGSRTSHAADDPRFIGQGRRPYGTRSEFETSARLFNTASPTPGTGSSRTPLQAQLGIITPSGLHFERHHSGVPSIDPGRHEVVVHGLVDRALAFDLEALLRLPSVSRVHFIECAGNSAREQEGLPGGTPQESHGLASCSEWTGVLLSTLLRHCGLRPSARWVVAEGADAARHTRSLPIDKCLEDVLVAYGQNGEALRPEQGSPLRLVVPGWEGNVNVKWLRRLEVSDEPAMSRDEAASYTDLLPNGKALQFTFAMGPKSVITRPAGGGRLREPGLHEISGFAWSGHGRVVNLEVSVDGGRSWQRAELDRPVLSKAFTRFHVPWSWDGGEATLQSRCTDETGAVQPTREDLVAARGLVQGPDGFNHYNGIKAWKVHADGSITAV